MEFLEVAVLALLAIAAAQTIGGRLRLAAPLLLVLVGIGVSLLPFIPPVVIEPEWILAGVLPPLLYSASAAMPAMDFRRDFTAISGLSVVLVVVSSVLLGLFFSWVVPDLSLAWGIALGAIVSPTDAVATSIVKRLGVSPRAVAILEGESLLNDATALVILRAGIAGAAAAVSLWAVFGQFVYAVVIAVIIGWAVGRLNLRVRAQVRESSVNTVLSFTIPFLASIPAELLGASGLVAALVAGLVTGRGAARMLSPQHRLSDSQNWRAIEVVLEGTVFLVMGLELSKVVADVRDEHQGFGLPIAVAAGALLLTVVIRTAYVALLIWGSNKRTNRGAEAKPRITDMQSRLDADEPFTFAQGDLGSGPRGNPEGRGRRREPSPASLERLRIRLRRGIADIDYFLAQPLGWREGVIVVWAGMRGAVTLAAAQTLPDDTPNRSLLILIAFLVAAASLLLQGGTIAAVVRRVKPAGRNPAVEQDEHVQLMELLHQTAVGVKREQPAAPGNPGDDEPKRLSLAVIDAQRNVLLDARDDGQFGSATLTSALEVLDAEQISLELKGGPSRD